MATKGHCMCGAIQVTLSETPSESVYCHCDNCKRQSGASGTYVVITDKDKCKIEGNAKRYIDQKTDSGQPLERWFCGDCGCPIYSATPLLPDKVVVKMGLFDQVPKAGAEWYCKNKQSWEPTIEGVTTYQTNPQAQ